MFLTASTGKDLQGFVFNPHKHVDKSHKTCPLFFMEISHFQELNTTLLHSWVKFNGYDCVFVCLLILVIVIYVVLD